MQKLYKINRF